MSLKNIFEKNGGGSKGWFTSFGWNQNNGNNANHGNNTNNRSSSNPFPSGHKLKKRFAEQQQEEKVLNTNDFRRKKKREENYTDDIKLHSLVIGLSVDSELQKYVEEEQKTRKLTLEREKKKQDKLRQLKEEKRKFDIALLINKNNQYYKILCGPITYEVFYKYLRFINCQNYISQDINVLKECCHFVDELQGNDIFEYFCNYSENIAMNGVKFDFRDILKCQLFQFKENKQIWINHKHKQQNTHCDILIIVNISNIPIYVLLDVDIDLIEETIKFCRYHEYENGDINLLDEIGNKLTGFTLNKTYSYFKKDRFNDIEFPHNFPKHIRISLNHAICYNFNNDINGKQKYFHQIYDIGLITNDNDESLYLLSNIQYDLINNIIQYKTAQIYRNGDYDKLKETGKQIKFIKINKFEAVNSNEINKNKYDFSGGNKCILFNVNNIDLWSEYVNRQKTAHYDVATITDSNNFQVYILNDVTVNWIDQILEFKMCEPFKSEHNKIIKHYGEFVSNDKLYQFKSNELNYYVDSNKTLKNIFFYQLKTHHNSFETEPEQKQILSSHKNVYETYITKTGFTPKNAQQLLEFAKIEMNVNMTYKEAKQIYDKNIHCTHFKSSTLINMTDRDSIIPDRMSVLQKIKKQIIEKQEEDEKNDQLVGYLQNNNNNNNHNHNNDDNIEFNQIWDLYLNSYGFEPENALQIRAFSQIHDNIKTLSYKEACQLFTYHNKK